MLAMETRDAAFATPRIRAAERAMPLWADTEAPRKQAKARPGRCSKGRSSRPSLLGQQPTGRPAGLYLHPGSLRQREVEPTAAGRAPGTAPSIDICSAPAPCLPGVGIAGRGKQCLLLRQEPVGNRNSTRCLWRKSWSPVSALEDAPGGLASEAVHIRSVQMV